jgi:phthalate 4,5-dioxygenase oxygenase subunit
MLSAEDNEILTRTGPGTLMGDLFRRFWIPVLLSCELPEPDCPPVRVRIMGEDLLAFRNSEGSVGVIEPRCSHRGADLFLGRVEDCGIRCAYHGWLFGTGGECLEAPTVSSNDTKGKFRERAAIRAYPVREAGDIVWAYMGPPERMPEFPMMEFTLVSAEHRFASKKLQEANWAQLCEGGLDTAHFSFLHMPVDVDSANIPTGAGGAGPQHMRWMKNDPKPRFSIKEHPAGLAMGGARHTDGEDTYWRIAQFLMPNHGFAPSTLVGRTYTGQTWVPIDDINTWVFCYSWNPEQPLQENEKGYVQGVPSIYSEVDENYVPIRNRRNGYMQDRTAQKYETFTGIVGVSEQDAAIQESQGRIADRTREQLGPTDLGVVSFRRLMIDAAKALSAGEEPPAAARPDAYCVRSGAIVTGPEKSFDEVLLTRFGTPNGEADRQYESQAAE